MLQRIKEQLYANQFNNLDEKKTFLEKHKLPKLTKKEINNLNYASLVKRLNL